jgi:hypothetical protein
LGKFADCAALNGNLRSPKNEFLAVPFTKLTQNRSQGNLPQERMFSISLPVSLATSENSNALKED